MQYAAAPPQDSFDVIIVGGGIMGAATAWFLVSNPDFDGSVLVVERDPSYAFSSTAHTNSCMRQQFSQPVNVEVSRFAADYVRNFRSYMQSDPDVPDLHMHPFGYMYLATTPQGEAALRDAQAMQRGFGAGTELLTPAQLAARYPFYNLDGVRLGSHNPVDEGYFDGATMFDWWRRKARDRGVVFLHGTVTGLVRKGDRISHVELDGRALACGWVVNASGPRAVQTARMAGLDLPVEPRKRYTYVFEAATPLDRDLPLTVDPSGVHVRSDGAGYMAGSPPRNDGPVAPDDFEADHALWEDKVWPALAHRIPGFEAIRLRQQWVGHYAYNTLDQNAILGPHPEVGNFLLINGFSGHGLQQAPAMGRGLAEWMLYGGYRELDLTAFAYDRIPENRPLRERAVI